MVAGAVPRPTPDGARRSGSRRDAGAFGHAPGGGSGPDQPAASSGPGGGAANRAVPLRRAGPVSRASLQAGVDGSASSRRCYSITPPRHLVSPTASAGKSTPRPTYSAAARASPGTGLFPGCRRATRELVLTGICGAPPPSNPNGPLHGRSETARRCGAPYSWPPRRRDLLLPRPRNNAGHAPNNYSE